MVITRVRTQALQPLLFAGLLIMTSLGAFATVPKLPLVKGPIPVTSESHILGAEDVAGATGSVDLKGHNYVEEEYFLTGAANIYQYNPDWSRTVKQKDVPYTTRMIVRRPQDPSKFSGTVHFECAHPQLGQALNWNSTKNYMVRHNDVYVGVMCGADLTTRKTPNTEPPTSAVDILKWFDAKRYASIDWPEDDGLRWDLMAQAGALLRSNDKSNPLRGYKVERMYAAGWSFTGSLWRVYINDGFHEEYRLPGGSPIFDGYLLGISSSTYVAGYDPLNNAQNLPVGNPRRVTKSIDVPVIELMSENEAVTNIGPQAPESDDAGSRHRLYEVPGLTHTSGAKGTMGQQVQLKERGYPQSPAELSVGACQPQVSDVPMSDLAKGVLANLDKWVRTGVPPPHAPRMRIDPETKKGLRDAYGNTQGGLRTAQLDVPLAKYGDYEDLSCSPGQPATGTAPGRGFLRVRRVPLAKEQLAQTYSGKDDYLAKFRARLDQLVKERWLLEGDANEQFIAAKVNADTAFK